MEVANRKETDVCHDSSVNLDETKTGEQQIRARCTLAKNVGLSVTGKQSSFKKLKACFESCKNHNKPQLHEMKATNEKHGRTEPKGWKRWWELCFSGCFIPKGRKFDDRCKGSIQFQSAIGCCLVRNHCTVLEEMEVAKRKETDVCHDSSVNLDETMIGEKQIQARCALAKNVGSSVEVKTGKHSSFKKLKTGKQSSIKKLKACFESCKNHNKPQLHEMKATNEKHGRTEPKGLKRWWESRFSGCFVPKGRKYDDRCKGSIQFQSAIGCCLVRNHCTVLEEMEAAKRKETDVCHDSSVNLDETKTGEKQIQAHQENLMGVVVEVGSAIRGCLARRNYNRRMNAIIIIQRNIKRWMVHRKSKDQLNGALVLQTAFRGSLARRNFVVRSLQSYLEEELEQERCALAENVGSFAEVKTGKLSSFEARFESCKNHNKLRLHEMKAAVEKHGRTEPKVWKRWRELSFSSCFVPKGRKFDDRCKGSVQFQSGDV